MNANRLWEICKKCAVSVYRSKRPTETYAQNVAKLLFGTAAQESSLIWERQRTPKWNSNVGGFSKWQLETGSINESLKLLHQSEVLARRVTDFIFFDDHAPLTWVDEITLNSILWAMRMDDNDKIGCAFARLHYLRILQPVPDSVEDQAGYWKAHYNTYLGKGTVEEYLKNWERYCAKIVNGD